MKYNNVCMYINLIISRYLFNLNHRYYIFFKISVDSFHRHCLIIENARVKVIDPFPGNAKGNMFIRNA